LSHRSQGPLASFVSTFLFLYFFFVLDRTLALATEEIIIPRAKPVVKEGKVGKVVPIQLSFIITNGSADDVLFGGS
jgi:hypothetical protein